MWKRSAVAALMASLAVGPAAAQTQAGVEYYYEAWNYYFVTSFPDEIAVLDGGAFGGVWKRTGQTFTVWSQPVAAAAATCRFFSTSFAPKSSHFYTPFAAECATVKNNRDWLYESVAYYLQLPDANGACPAGTDVLFRLYNNGMGGAPNHRYTERLATFQQMIAAGWVFEGNGVTGAFACVPRLPAEGYWVGSLATGEQISGVILSDSTFYFFHSGGLGSKAVGIVQGTAVGAGDQFTSADAHDFAVGAAVTNLTIAGTFVAKTSLNGTLTTPKGPAAFTTAYQTAYEHAADLAAAAGTFSGNLGAAAGFQNVTVTLGLDGTLSGGAAGCALTGTLTPHGAVAVFDAAITLQGNACMFGPGSAAGAAFYDAPNRQLTVTAQNASRTDAILISATKPSP